MSKHLFLLAGLAAAVALIGCGDKTTIKTEVEPDDLCVRLNTVCNDPTGQISCDPVDGQCKCGGKDGNGITCAEGEVCHLNSTFSPPAPSCVSVLCDGVLCDRYEACDPTDGVCKCSGIECAPGLTCVQGVCEDTSACFGVVCREGETCDPVDRTCKCGDEICSVGESCRVGSENAGYCVGKRCVGMNCPIGSECSPVDGLCHCGGVDGEACTAGQACVDGECVGHDICDGVICTGGTTCSPLDGQCRCGGFDGAAPICGGDQTCDQTTGQCVGGDVCANVTCDPSSNTSCDEEQGICKCGGTGGVVCEAEEGCVAALATPLCVTRCSPLTPNVEVATCGQTVDGPRMGCYYSPADSIAFCSGAGTQVDGGECESITDCAAGSHCVQNGDSGVCRPYCNIREANSCYSSDRLCVGPIAGATGAMADLGVCLTVGP